MNIIISNSSSIPIYEQIIKQIKKSIFSNEIREEELLPSVRSLANELKISFLTVKKAYDELEKQGFIKTVHAKNKQMVSAQPSCSRITVEERLGHVPQTN